MEFYLPSQKIKLMRKKFRVNQSELEGENMTRAFISMMESGKRTVSKASSRKLVEKFKNIGSRIHVNIEIDDEYFSRSPEEDARYYCENKIKKEQSIKHKDLDKLIEIERAFGLNDLLAETYKKKGILYFNENEYVKSFINFHNALGKYKEIRAYVPQIEVLCYLGNCKLRCNQFDDSIFFYKEAIKYAEEHERQRFYFIASHSLATIYGQIKKYDKCLEVLENNILKNEDKVDKVILVNAKLMKANVFLATERNHEAAKGYFDIVEEVKVLDPSLLGLIYNNIAEYYYKIENYEKALVYVTEAQKHKLATNKEFLSSTLGLKGKILLGQGMREESILLYELAIDMAEQYRRFDMLVENYRELMKILEDNNDTDKMETKLNSMIETLEINKIEDGIQYALVKLMEVATLKNQNEKAMQLSHRLECLV
ncbi:helix-turn-helix transcriptional regulator [Clostridium sp. C8-1-8]|uniref:helix-turn-helix transcriptional regulator n=1 Tax=Clostridium sp. C8-1-8 TaxID=2698831 RepID=UPI0013716CF4|nr:helix-turn-helix transcriptional regulator [Clostridium sp. C8-1-8]